MFGLSPVLLMCAVLFTSLLCLALVSDFHAFRIPNRISLALIALYPVYLTALPHPVDWLSALGIFTVTLALGMVAFAFRTVGGGDIKLLAAVSLWAGADGAISFFFVTAMIGGALSLLLVSPYRVNIAHFCDTAGQLRMRDVFLGNTVPYGLAIGSAGILVVTPRILNVPLW